MEQPNKLELKEGAEGKAFIQEKTEDWHADFQGQLLCADGVIRYVNIYENTSQATGKRWLKFKMGNPVGESSGAKPSAPVQNTQPASKPVAESFNELEDDLPF
jgi:hypothetical protein